MEKKDKIDELLAGYYKEKNKRPVSDGFARRVMIRAREESVTAYGDLLRDNLWIILMASILLLLVAVVLVAKHFSIDLGMNGKLYSSFDNHSSTWFQIMAMITAGAFWYFSQLMRARFQID
jgi:hypothetical protein